jgi:hypothetical protein
MPTLSEYLSMTVKSQVRRTNRNGLVVAVLIAAVGFAVFVWGERAFPWFVAVALVSTGVVLGMFTVAGMIWPRAHLMLRRLSAFGPPLEIAAAVDAELALPEKTAQFGQPVRSFRISSTGKFPIIVTPSWVVQFGEVSLRIARLDEIQWFYKKTLTQTYGLGVKDRWHSLVVQGRSGRLEEFTQAESEVDRLLEFLRVLLPGVACGFPRTFSRLQGK